MPETMGIHRMKMKPTLLMLLFGVLAAGAKDLPPTAEEQQALRPQQVLDDLMAGNQRFVAGKPRDPNVSARIAVTEGGQFPKAYVLSCVDSRVPVEQVFDQGIGDIFVGRVAGNIESTEQLGSIEFATRVAGARLVLVLGHEACGAVMGACDHVEMGHLTLLLKEISPAVEAVAGHAEDRSSKNQAFVNEVIEKNVRLTVEDLRKRSEVLAGLEKDGRIRIVGGVYSLEDGRVRLLE